VAASSPGFTGADLANVINEAALLAVRDRAVAVNRAHLDEAVERVVGGPRRRAAIYTPEEKLRIAHHEGGHAVVAAALGKIGSLDKLSIISRGRGIGHLALLDGLSILPTRGEMEANIAIAMAGIAAEELVYGEPSTGSEADLQRATTMARDMAGRYGMTERLGRVRVLNDHREVFLGRDYLLTKEVSQPTLEHLDAEVKRILAEQEAVARAILTRSRDVLDSLADDLVAYETLKSGELHDALAGVPVVGGRGNGTASTRSAWSPPAS
jgi:cell division protease FtsH